MIITQGIKAINLLLGISRLFKLIIVEIYRENKVKSSDSERDYTERTSSDE